MSTTVNSKSETIKNSLQETAAKSKETIREIVNANSKYIDSALETNKKVVDAIKKNLNQNEIEDSVTYDLKNTFGKSVELAEKTIDSVISAYLKQVEWNLEQNTKLIDVFKENYNSNPEKVLNLIYENFETTRELTVKSTKDILEYYNKHTNLALNFNKKFATNIATQLELLTYVQRKGLTNYSEWVTDWWKDTQKEYVQ